MVLLIILKFSLLKFTNSELPIRVFKLATQFSILNSDNPALFVKM